MMQLFGLQGAGLFGAGDFLMSFLGVIILSFAFKIFDQRRLMVRHAPEILGSCTASAAISMLGTALLCRLAGLDPRKPKHRFEFGLTLLLSARCDTDPDS